MATRTQVYFSEQQRKRIDAVRKQSGKSLAQIVREAVDLYLGEARPDARATLDTTFGGAAGLEVPNRAEWKRRG